MASPEIPQKVPYGLQLERGTYWWCACGRSNSQPFCDGAHAGSEFQPVEYRAELDGTVYFCGCKHNAGGVLCDGSHSRLRS